MTDDLLLRLDCPGGVQIDLLRERAYLHDVPVALSPQEWRVLAVLARHAGQVVSKAQIATELGLPESSNNAEFHVSRLRRKLERSCIQTIRGRGYRLVV